MHCFETKAVQFTNKNNKMDFKKFIESLNKNERFQLHNMLSEELGYDTEIRNYKVTKTHVLDFISSNIDKIPVRLKSSLHQYHSNFVIRKNYSAFVDDIDKNTFMKIEGAGLKTWVDFCKLRNNFLNT